MAYSQINYVAEVNVGSSPDITAEWCGYNPNTYSINAFFRGIYTDIYMGVITRMKKTMPAGHAFLLSSLDQDAFIGDAFRHIEVGESFIKDYVEVEGEGEDLGPKSAPHLNIISETDRLIEKWEVACSHNRDTFGQFFKSYADYLELVKLLEGNLRQAIENALSIIIKSIICANPAKIIFGDKDFARIFGKTKIDPHVTQTTTSKAGRAYNILMQSKIKKYYGKSVELWKNIQFYNPYLFTTNFAFEEPKKDLYYESHKPEEDRARKVTQEIYTNAHAVIEDESNKTHFIDNLHRNDCLFALYDFISKAVNVMTTEKSSEYWLGNDTAITIYDTKAAKDRARQQGLGLDGRPLAGQGAEANIIDTQATSSADDSFEVKTEREFLGVYLNPEDYIDLKNGIARRGPIDVRAANLSMLGEDLNIFPERSMPPGFVRIVDKRALVIKPFFEFTDVQTPMEKIHWRYKAFFQFAIAIFKNFAGCLGLPSTHFIAAPRLYDKYSLIGQELEKKK